MATTIWVIGAPGSSSSSRGLRWCVLSLWYVFFSFFTIIFSSFSFICILSFNSFPHLFILSICNYCILTCSQFTYLSILLILMLPILYHTCSSILFMSTFYCNSRNVDCIYVGRHVISKSKKKKSAKYRRDTVSFYSIWPRVWPVTSWKFWPFKLAIFENFSYSI